jgi:hypothetical protein
MDQNDSFEENNDQHYRPQGPQERDPKRTHHYFIPMGPKGLYQSHQLKNHIRSKGSHHVQSSKDEAVLDSWVVLLTEQHKPYKVVVLVHSC